MFLIAAVERYRGRLKDKNDLLCKENVHLHSKNSCLNESLAKIRIVDMLKKNNALNQAHAAAKERLQVFQCKIESQLEEGLRNQENWKKKKEKEWEKTLQEKMAKKEKNTDKEEFEQKLVAQQESLKCKIQKQESLKLTVSKQKLQLQGQVEEIDKDLKNGPQAGMGFTC
ncbi:hypothetical protein EST38_g11128 [Candolleomyces aberdarensis]|uniref:Uncharacterized protein n=1 Tax=Candolleomyces aberdarensis TaxID=2316362 RepID=A0A4Q2D7Z6_9AGAR|nr:hypothetical protein EST38_g11128 [Candolleomyces aberdarensis]